MIAASTSTTTISRMVKPRSLVRDIPVFTLAAVLAVGSERHEVEGLALARNRVAIVVAPGVLEIGILRVGAAPFLHAGGLAHQGLQGVGIFPHFQAVELDLPHELLDADLRLARLGAPHLLEDLGTDKGHDSGEQDEDDHDLEDREAAAAAVANRASHGRHLAARSAGRRRTASPRGWR